jgi:hypothetical protein
MKKYTAIAAAVLMFVGLSHAQTKPANKISDAYAVQARRIIITPSEATEDKIKELEALISSPVEQKNFDAIISFMQADMVVVDATTKAFGTEKQPEAEERYERARIARKPCWDGIKANLSRRDGSIPQACNVFKAK